VPSTKLLHDGVLPVSAFNLYTVAVAFHFQDLQKSAEAANTVDDVLPYDID